MEYVPDTSLGRAYSIDAAAATAWRHGELVFDRRPCVWNTRIVGYKIAPAGKAR